ncbi:hypothetical protein HN954_04980 [bacterium]|jgi:hypothetical protein|nr:hypothetical protein [bacterium]MBT6831804.1 hypothetical protein [bacterium]MBT6996749.1 hypothetical protein [bacterium]MBT7772197.1 hypothetical protein [bacterium]
MKKIALFLRIVVPSIFLFCSFGMVNAAAYTHSPSTIVAKTIGGKLTISDFNTIRTTLDNVFYDNSNQFLGIGATDPMVALDVAGGVRIRDFSTAGFVKNGEDGNLSGGNSLTGADLTGFDEGGVTFGGSDGALTQDATNIFWDDSDNFLGIGTSVPDSELHVVGEIKSDNFRTDETTKHTVFVGDDAGGTATETTFIGEHAGESNSGVASNAVGNSALESNTGASSNAMGNSALQFNTGENSNAMGGYAMQSNTGDFSNAMGHRSLQFNTGANLNAMGSYALRYNDGDSNTAIGNEAFNAWTDDTASAKNVSSVNFADNQVTISGHGFTGSRNFVATTTGTLPAGLAATANQWVVIDANTLECKTSSFTDAGTGTLTLTPKIVFSNSIALGNNAEPDASNQAVIGDTSLTQVKTAGAIFSSNTGDNYFAGNVGIGTTDPVSKLEIVNGSILASGTTGTTPVSGAGTRMMWIPEKGAFRAGDVVGTQWDDVNIGESSTAFGENTIASGVFSVAFGLDATASGYDAVAFGHDTTASGIISVAFGNSTTASGHYSTAFGVDTTASGNHSTALGYNTAANGYSTVALGRYNVGGGTATSWVATDPLFEIGIGTAPSSRANALTVLKNGNIGIGTSSPVSKLEVDGSAMADYFVGDGSRLTNLPAGEWTETAGILSPTTGADDVAIDTDTLFVDVSADKVGIGTVSPSANLHVGDGVALAAAWPTGYASIISSRNNNYHDIAGYTASNTRAHRTTFYGERSRNTTSSPTAVQENDMMLSLIAGGYDGAVFQNPTAIDFYVDGTPSSGSVPGRISFVTGTSVGNRSERMVVKSSGNVGINTSLPLSKFGVLGNSSIGETYGAIAAPTSGLIVEGNVGIGTTDPDSKLDISGTLKIATDSSVGGSTSDCISAAHVGKIEYVEVDTDLVPDGENNMGSFWGCLRVAEGTSSASFEWVHLDIFGQ